MSNLERWDFIKKTVIGGIGATLLNEAVANNAAASPELQYINKSGKPEKVIVGGAGIGGLCCAYELMKKGHEVGALEAAGRHGGLSDGLYGDLGQELALRLADTCLTPSEAYLGPGKLVERVRAYNPQAAPLIQEYHALRLIPQSKINLTATTFEQNTGYFQ